MDNIPEVKIVIAIFMNLALAALIMLALSTNITLPMRVAVITASIYGLYEIDKWLKK